MQRSHPLDAARERSRLGSESCVPGWSCRSAAGGPRRGAGEHERARMSSNGVRDETCGTCLCELEVGSWRMGVGRMEQIYTRDTAANVYSGSRSGAKGEEAESL